MKLNIEALAREAGLDLVTGHWSNEGAVVCTGALFGKFAALVLEEAAKACESPNTQLPPLSGQGEWPRVCAAAIRALKVTP